MTPIETMMGASLPTACRMDAAARARTASWEAQQLVLDAKQLQYQEKTLKEQITRHTDAQRQRAGQAQAQEGGQAVAEPHGFEEEDLTLFGLQQELVQLKAQLEVNHSELQAAFSTAEARTAELLGKHAFCQMWCANRLDATESAQRLCMLP